MLKILELPSKDKQKLIEKAEFLNSEIFWALIKTYMYFCPENKNEYFKKCCNLLNIKI